MTNESGAGRGFVILWMTNGIAQQVFKSDLQDTVAGRACDDFGFFLLATPYSLPATFRPLPMSDAKLTPMMQQYFEVKRGLPRDTLLLFRLGDFFELFFEDAVAASKLLGLTLTKRQETPMAGLPAQALDNYVSKLLAAGKKVAI